MTAVKDMNFDHLIGLEIGTATLLKELGRGAMAVVFTAYQRTLKRQIAVKILPKEILTPEKAAWFQQEAEMAAILSHPNIIPIYEVGQTEAFLFFTMQLVQGRSLSDFIVRSQKQVVPSRRFFPLSTALQLTLAILDGLAYAHAQEIVHRDIKPSNILIEKHTKRPIIMDFGISQTIRESGLAETGQMGSPTYAAPEQIRNSKVDGRADVYAVGMMLFQMLVARLPFKPYDSPRALLKMKLTEETVFDHRPSELNPAVPAELDEIIWQALARDPADRYTDCRAFAQALQKYRPAGETPI